MYCLNCGKEISNKAFYCPYCGCEQVRHKKVVNSLVYKKGDADPKCLSKSNIVANEVIANLKMLGCALLFSSLYIGIFLLYHYDGRKPAPNAYYYGSSCYDEPFMSFGELDWEKIYNTLSHNYYLQKLQHQDYSSPPSEEALRNHAKAIAKSNQEEATEMINEHRMNAAKKDLMTHIKYCLLISLSVTVFGRYLIKGAKWVFVNKT